MNLHLTFVYSTYRFYRPLLRIYELYLKIWEWEWIFGSVVYDISSLGVRTLCPQQTEEKNLKNTPDGPQYNPSSLPTLTNSMPLMTKNPDFATLLRTPNESFFHRNPKLLGLGKQSHQMNFGAFLAILSDPILVLWVPLFQPITKPLYVNPKYLFGIEIWIWIWAAEN